MALIPSLAQAQSAGFSSGFGAVDNARAAAGVKGFGSVSGFILSVLAVVGSLIAVLALAALVWGAIMYITSLGDEGKTEKAKKIILSALVGLLILGAAGIIVNVVINLIST